VNFTDKPPHRPWHQPATNERHSSFQEKTVLQGCKIAENGFEQPSTGWTCGGSRQTLSYWWEGSRVRTARGTTRPSGAFKTLLTRAFFLRKAQTLGLGLITATVRFRESTGRFRQFGACRYFLLCVVYSVQMGRRYLHRHRLGQQKYVLVRRKKKKTTPLGRLLDDPTQGRYPMQASGEKEFVRQHTRHILYPQNWGKSKVGTSVCHAWRRKAKALIGRYASIYAMPTNKSSLPPWWLPLLRLRTAHLRHGQHNISFSTCVAQRTHISALSILSTLRTGSLTFMSSVTFIPYTILSTASPRCCGCCARLWGVANDCCGRRAAAARVDAGAKVEAKPLFRITAAVVRVNRACNIPPLARQRN